MDNLDGIRESIQVLLDLVDAHDLPAFYSITPKTDTGTIEVDWMLQEDEKGARRVISALPGHWRQHPYADRESIVLVYKDEFFEVNLWCPQGTVEIKIVVPT